MKQNSTELRLSQWHYTIQMTLVGKCDMQIYVPKLKCQHEGTARVLTFQLRDIYVYIFACHMSPSCVICFVASLTKIRLNSVKTYIFLEWNHTVITSRHNYLMSRMWSHAHSCASANERVRLAVMHDGLVWHDPMSHRIDVTLDYVTQHVTEFWILIFFEFGLQMCVRECLLQSHSVPFPTAHSHSYPCCQVQPCFIPIPFKFPSVILILSPCQSHRTCCYFS